VLKVRQRFPPPREWGRGDGVEIPAQAGYGPSPPPKRGHILPRVHIENSTKHMYNIFYRYAAMLFKRGTKVRNTTFRVPGGTVALCLLILVLALSTGCNDLQIAAREGNLQQVKTLIESGFNVNSATLLKHETALHLAAENGHADVVKYLLEKGARVNSRAEGGDTPLHRASYYGHVDTMKILLENGAGVSEKGTGCGTPLQWAAQAGRIDAAKLLLAHDADINQKGTDEYTALGTAVSHGQIEMVRFLVAKGADVNARAVYGATPLHVAAWKNDVQIGRILLAHGADPTLECNGRLISRQFLQSLQQE